jgi:hypothetical protein
MLQNKLAFKERNYETLGITGRKTVSRFVNDSFDSTCGRFSVVSTDHLRALPLRLRTPGLDCHFYSLRVDGKEIGKTKSYHAGLNWLVKKVRPELVSEPLFT